MLLLGQFSVWWHGIYLKLPPWQQFLLLQASRLFTYPWQSIREYHCPLLLKCRVKKNVSSTIPYTQLFCIKSVLSSGDLLIEIKNRVGLFRNCGLLSECHPLMSYLMSNTCIFLEAQIWSSCLLSIHLYLVIFGLFFFFLGLLNKLIHVLSLSSLFFMHTRLVSSVLSVRIATYSLLYSAYSRREYHIPHTTKWLYTRKTCFKISEQESKRFSTAWKYYMIMSIPTSYQSNNEKVIKLYLEYFTFSSLFTRILVGMVKQ